MRFDDALFWAAPKLCRIAWNERTQADCLCCRIREERERIRMNPKTPSVRPPRIASGRDDTTTVLSMVGLPARGKTYIARRVARYLNWLGHPTRVFNVGNYRRKILGASQPADFFAPSNTAGRKVLNELAMQALE